MSTSGSRSGRVRAAPGFGVDGMMDREKCVAFGRRMSAAREKHGLSQSELASALHVSRSAVGQWEIGNTYPAIDTSARIAEYLGVTPQYLLYGIEDQTSTGGDSIDLLIKRNGTVSVLSHFDLPREFSYAGIANRSIKAIVVFSSGEVKNLNEGDIAIFDSSDRDARKKGRFVLEYPDRFGVAIAQTFPGAERSVRVVVGGEPFDLADFETLVRGRIVATVCKISGSGKAD